MFPVSSILWPTDGSDSSYRALDAAVEIASRFNAVIYALQVVQKVPPLVAGSGYSPMAVRGFDVQLYQQELLKNAENELSRVVAEKIPQGIEVVSEVKVGEPQREISKFAEENGVGLVVMATQGRTGLSHFIIGSVAEETIRQSTTPILVIPAVSDRT